MPDLLEVFKKDEDRKLHESPIRHPGTIGDMYEGLTAKMQKMTLPCRGLSVVTGFAKDYTGNLQSSLLRRFPPRKEGLMSEDVRNPFEQMRLVHEEHVKAQDEVVASEAYQSQLKFIGRMTGDMIHLLNLCLIYSTRASEYTENSVMVRCTDDLAQSVLAAWELVKQGLTSATLCAVSALKKNIKPVPNSDLCRGKSKRCAAAWYGSWPELRVLRKCSYW